MQSCPITSMEFVSEEDAMKDGWKNVIEIKNNEYTGYLVTSI